jgi:hypothetical protein
MRPTRITRLLRLEAQAPDTNWQHTEGLSALLAASSHLPRRDEPVDLEDVDTTTGMGRLLAEARAWKQEHPRGRGAGA